MAKIPFKTQSSLLRTRQAYFLHLQKAIEEIEMPEEEKKILTDTTKTFQSNYIWRPTYPTIKDQEQAIEIYESLNERLKETKKGLIDAAVTRILPHVHYKEEASKPQRIPVKDSFITYQRAVLLADTEDNRIAIIRKNDIEGLKKHLNDKIAGHITAQVEPITAASALYICGSTLGLASILAKEYTSGILGKLKERKYIATIPEPGNSL